MLRQVFVMSNGLICAMDEKGQQVSEAQGDIVEFYYRFMKEKGLADGSTTFERVGIDAQVETGDQLETKWRTAEIDPTS